MRTVDKKGKWGWLWRRERERESTGAWEIGGKSDKLKPKYKVNLTNY